MLARSFLKAAFVMGAAFLLLNPPPAEARGSEKKKTENHKDIIDKASNLALQKDRAQALHVLLSALKRESAGSSAAAELKTALQEISNLFLAEKTQQLYELGLSLKKADPAQAQMKISEALRLEPDNALLLIENARLLMARGDCPGASEAIQKQRKLNPQDEVAILVQAQAAACQGDWQGYATAKAAAATKSAPSQSWLFLELEKALKDKSENKAKEIFEKARKADARHPDLTYWSWRIEKDPARQQALAQRYLTVCRNLSAGVSRQYMMEPMLCRRTAEVETFMKNAGANQ